MKHYHAKTLEFTKEGFTDLFILNTSNNAEWVPGQTQPAVPVNDFAVGFSAQAIVLTALNSQDVILGGLIDIHYPIVGPTGAPTAQLATSVGAVAITPTATVVTGLGSVTNNTVVGSTISAGNENLVLNLAAGGGNGAAAAAGEIWVWVKIARNDRFQTAA